MKNLPRLFLAALAATAACAAVPAVGSASMIVDRNAVHPRLLVSADGKTALVRYTRAGGKRRNVLFWGAVDWTSEFSRDYSGGWGSKRADARTFKDHCRPYTGPELPLMVAACDAADGSHWALQRWARLWNNYGGRSAKKELHLSHWTGDVGVLEIKTDWSYRGKHEHLWGRFTYHGKPVFGNRWTIKGVPLDSRGRNIYLDYHKDGVWQRENSFLTHPGTAGFCYTFALHNGRYGVGDAYRATVIGPGVSPLVRIGFSPPGTYDRALDDAANEEQRALLGDDRRCKIN